MADRSKYQTALMEYKPEIRKSRSESLLCDLENSWKKIMTMGYVPCADLMAPERKNSENMLKLLVCTHFLDLHSLHCTI